jgi:hypothetical protein
LVVFNSSIFFSASNISADIFAAIVFIAAGPALGLTLLQLHRSAVSIHEKISARKDEKRLEYLNCYANFCLQLTDVEKNKLDETEAYYDFSISTALAFFGLSAIGFVRLGPYRFEPFMFLIGGIILLIGGYLEWSDSYSPIYMVLNEKYSKKPEDSHLAD